MQYGGVIFLDLDKFKALNDIFGHQIGDEMLIEVAKRLSLSIRAIDTPSRFGGDEFIVLIEDLGTNFEIANMEINLIAEKLKLALNQTYNLSCVDYEASASIGIRIFSGIDNINQILHDADLAMYQDKNNLKM